MKKFMRINVILFVFLSMTLLLVYTMDAVRLREEADKIDFKAYEITVNKINKNNELIPFTCIEYNGHKYYGFNTSLYCYDKELINEPLAIVKQKSLKKSVDEIKYLYGFKDDLENYFVYYDMQNSSVSNSCLYYREDLNLPKFSDNSIGSIVIVDNETEIMVCNITNVVSIKQIISTYSDMSLSDGNDKILEYIYSDGFIGFEDSVKEYEVRAYFIEFPNLYFSIGNIECTETGRQEFKRSFNGDWEWNTEDGSKPLKKGDFEQSEQS